MRICCALTQIYVNKSDNKPDEDNEGNTGAQIQQQGTQLLGACAQKHKNQTISTLCDVILYI